MPKVHPRELPDAAGATIEPGDYLAFISAIEVVEPGTKREWWKITWKIMKEGPEKGREIKDNLFFFNEKTASRVKLYLSRLGFDVEAEELDVEKEDFEGKQAIIVVKLEKGSEFIDQNTGQKRMGFDRNVIDFGGIKAVEQVELGKDDDTPF